MYFFIILYIIAWFVGVVSAAFLVWPFLKKVIRESNSRKFIIPSLGIVAAVILGIYSQKTYPPDFAMPPGIHSMAPGGISASIPFSKIIDFLKDSKRFEQVSDIGMNPNDVPPPLNRAENQTVKISMTAKEVISEVAKGIYFNYWTYNGKVPGPMFRVLEGDTVEVSLTNDSSSLHPHNIDFHAVNGPGGGSKLSSVMPGETKTFRWKALNPGLYVYHCATPNVSTHNSHGQYGMILVEPKGGLSKVDKEFYLMQGELYTTGDLGKKGLTMFDAQALLDGKPNYITFNGKIETAPRMSVNTGEKIRIFAGNGGVNLISSFHIIGAIFDNVYPEGAIGSPMEKNVQTTALLPGGSAIVEFTLKVPGTYLAVDHALARMNKGAWAAIDAKGNPAPDIYSAITSTSSGINNAMPMH